MVIQHPIVCKAHWLLMLRYVQRSIGEWNFVDFQEEFLFGWSDYVFFVTMFEGIIECLLEFWDGLNWAHISHIFLVFFAVWSTIDEQIFLFALFHCDGTVHFRRIGLRWNDFWRYFLLSNRLWLVFADKLKAACNNVTQSLTTLAFYLIYLFNDFILQILRIVIDLGDQVLAFFNDITLRVVFISIVHILFDVF